MGMRWTAALCALVVWSCAAAAAHDLYTIQRDGVLGTSLEMQVAGVPAPQAQQAVAAALAEVARLEAQLSTWRTDSALSAYNAGDLPAEDLPADVSAVLALCEHWRARTGGSFSCWLGALIARWREADATEVLPDRGELRRQARALAALTPPRSGALDVQSGLRADVDGVAKGYVLDQALARARRVVPAARGIRIDIGGDAVYWGRPGPDTHWQVDIADARTPLDNAPGLVRVQLRDQAIAASGHHSRGYRVGRRQFSHILDPREGWPLSFAPAATVVARDAASADALATALTVLPIQRGLALVDGIDGAAALIVSDAGTAFASTRWPALVVTQTAAAPATPRLLIDYEIPALAAANYRQPYLALWIEHEQGRPLRQLHVLGDRARWLTELPRWWRQYGRNDAAAALGIARPTRAPGRYTVAWDGRDDHGRLLPPGRYLLRIEAAREHGGHEVLALPFLWGPGLPPLRVSGRAEVGVVTLRQDG